VFFRAGILVCALAATQFACQNKTLAPPPHYAFLRFENLSGDPSLEWIGRAASELLPFSLAGALDGAVLGAGPVTTPGVSSARANAILAGATRAITGYIERAGGRIRITAIEEDLATGKSLRTLTAADPSPLPALIELAREFSPKFRPFPTSNVNALRTWSAARDAPSPKSRELLEESLRNDPGFGAAWVALAVNDFARGDRAGAMDVIERARRQTLDPLSQANLDFEQATFTGDQPKRMEALRKISRLSPGDTTLLRSLAEAETAAGQFGAAASDWQRVAATLPNDPLAWNSLGYIRSYAGDYTGALAALREYARLRPKDPNPSDSIGDLNYSFRKFADAAANYREADSKQPGYEQYAGLYKAAWAKFYAGDKTGADKLFAAFRTAREKETGGPAPLLAADWLYRTGRKPEGIAALRKLAAETNATPLRSNALSLLTIWDLLQGDRAQAAKDSAAIGEVAVSAPILLARFAALPSATAEQWKSRAGQVGSLRQLAIGYALLLDGKRNDALPVWKAIVEAAPATDFFARALYTHLQGKQIDRPLLPDARNFNPFLALLE
jgi:tetratricopeptide (TPR) repeat protein